MPETSIVVRAFNEERHLPRLFDGLATQTYRDFEVVLVDSGSFDHTREVAARRGARVVRIASHDFTFGHSLNVGIQRGVGRLIVIVSAHTVPVDARWLERLLAPLADPGTALVYGRQIGSPDSRFSERQDFERTFGREPRILAPPRFFANNANSATRRDCWLEHPFDETLPGLEDVEWAKHWMERGLRVVYAADACIYHIHTEAWPQVRHRYFREGQAAKWIGVHRRRDIPGVLWREALFLVADLAAAAAQSRLRVAPEIARFRVEKTLGTVGGIWSGATMQNPLKRERLLFDRSQRAVVVRGPGRAALEQVELPPIAPGEVLIRVAYVGVSTSDLAVAGVLPASPGRAARYPVVPGPELSGTVAAVGARVGDLREGDRVVLETVHGCGGCRACHAGNAAACPDRRDVGIAGRDGGYAQYVVVPGRVVHRVPAGLGLKEAALAAPLAAVLKGLRRLERAWSVEPPRHACVVVGAGPVGHLAARILALRGHEVTVFDRNPERLAALAGAEARGETALRDLGDFDAVVEATGSSEVLAHVLATAAPGAAVLLLGLPYGRRDVDVDAIVAADRLVAGSAGSGAEDLEEALATLPKIDVSALTRLVLPLDRFRQAWSLARAGGHVKVLLAVDEAAR